MLEWYTWIPILSTDKLKWSWATTSCLFKFILAALPYGRVHLFTICLISFGYLSPCSPNIFFILALLLTILCPYVHFVKGLTCYWFGNSLLLTHGYAITSNYIRRSRAIVNNLRLLPITYTHCHMKNPKTEKLRASPFHNYQLEIDKAVRPTSSI